VTELHPKGGFPRRDSPPAPAPPPFEVRVTGADRLGVVEGAAKGTTLDVVRDEGGRIVWLRAGGRLHRRVD